MGFVKKAVSGVLNIAKKVLSSPLVGMLAPFIPVVGPFIATAARIYQGVQALRSGNLLGAAGSFLGGGGMGGALNSTFSNVLGKVGNFLGPNVMSFATSAVGAMGGNTSDVLRLANLAKNTLAQTQNQEVLTGARHNALRLLQYAASRQFA